MSRKQKIIFAGDTFSCIFSCNIGEAFVIPITIESKVYVAIDCTLGEAFYKTSLNLCPRLSHAEIVNFFIGKK